MRKNSVKSISILSLGTATLLMASGAQALNFKVDKTDVDVYGYAKLDVIYDVDADLTNTVNRGKSDWMTPLVSMGIPQYRPSRAA